jgi:hypothetical protein
VVIFSLFRFIYNLGVGRYFFTGGFCLTAHKLGVLLMLCRWSCHHRHLFSLFFPGYLSWVGHT